jgi:hypothetical protein
VAVVMEALDGGFLDGAVHPLYLSVGPRVVRFGETVLDVVASQIMSKRICREKAVFRLRG